MPRYITVTPAYGRDYTSQAKVRQAWADGLDFIVADYDLPARPINKSDATALFPTAVVNLRYAKLTKVVTAI